MTLAIQRCVVYADAAACFDAARILPRYAALSETLVTFALTDDP